MLDTTVRLILRILVNVVVGIASMVPLYWTLEQLNALRFITPAGRHVINHPVSIVLLAFGVSYASLGSTASAVQALAVASLVMYYTLILHPEVGSRYINLDALMRQRSVWREDEDDDIQDGIGFAADAEEATDPLDL